MDRDLIFHGKFHGKFHGRHSGKNHWKKSTPFRGAFFQGFQAAEKSARASDGGSIAKDRAA